MKITLALAALMAAFALASAQTEPAWCRCASFVSSRRMEIMVLELPEVEITDCQNHNQCRNRCIAEINEMTNEMDLWSLVEAENDTVGQFFCKELFQHGLYWIHNSYVHGYYEMCGGPWEYTGIDSQQMLCCTNSEQVHCVTK